MEKNKYSKLSKLIFNITIILFIFFVALFSILSIVQSSYMQFDLEGHRMVYRGLFTIRSFIFFVVLGFFTYLICRFGDKISSKKVLIIEMVLLAITGALYCFSYNNINIDCDTEMVYNTVKSLTNGDYSLIDSKTYIGKYPNNLGLLTEYWIFVNVFGDGFFIFKYMRFLNLIVALLGYIYLYKTTDILYKNNKANLFILLLILGFNHLLLYSVFIYTNVTGYCFAIVSIYYLIYYLKNGKRLWLSFIFIVLSIFMRQNSMIILIAELIVLLMKAFNERKLVNYILVVIFSLGLFTTKGLIKYYEHKYHVVYDHVLPVNIHIFYGFNYTDETPGGYFPYLEEMYEKYDYDKHSVDEYGEKYVNDALNYFKKEPLKCVEFYIKKYISTWLDQDYDVFTIGFNEECTIEKYEPLMNDYYDAFLSLMAIGLVLYILKNRKILGYDFILIVSIIGGFLFHSFWEVKAIYTYQYVLLLLPLSAYGLTSLFNNIKKIYFLLISRIE